jgi:hypothetical protein
MNELEQTIRQAERVLNELRLVKTCADISKYAFARGYAEAGVEDILEFLKGLKEAHDVERYGF